MTFHLDCLTCRLSGPCPAHDALGWAVEQNRLDYLDYEVDLYLVMTL